MDGPAEGPAAICRWRHVDKRPWRFVTFRLNFHYIMCSGIGLGGGVKHGEGGVVAGWGGYNVLVVCVLIYIYLCSDTYSLRSCDRHAVCFCAERSGAANSSFSRLGCNIGIAIAARSGLGYRQRYTKIR